MKKGGKGTKSSPHTRAIDKKIRALEANRFQIINTIEQCKANKQDYSTLQQTVFEIGRQIENQLKEKIIATLKWEEDHHIKMRKLLNSIGKNSSKYWSIIRGKDGSISVNTIKNQKGRDGNLKGRGFRKCKDILPRFIQEKRE